MKPFPKKQNNKLNRQKAWLFEEQTRKEVVELIKTISGDSNKSNALSLIRPDMPTSATFYCSQPREGTVSCTHSEAQLTDTSVILRD